MRLPHAATDEPDRSGAPMSVAPLLAALLSVLGTPVVAQSVPDSTLLPGTWVTTRMTVYAERPEPFLKDTTRAILRFSEQRVALTQRKLDQGTLQMVHELRPDHTYVYELRWPVGGGTDYREEGTWTWDAPRRELRRMAKGGGPATLEQATVIKLDAGELHLKQLFVGESAGLAEEVRHRRLPSRTLH